MCPRWAYSRYTHITDSTFQHNIFLIQLSIPAQSVQRCCPLTIMFSPWGRPGDTSNPNLGQVEMCLLSFPSREGQRRLVLENVSTGNQFLNLPRLHPSIHTHTASPSGCLGESNLLLEGHKPTHALRRLMSASGTKSWRMSCGLGKRPLVHAPI